jgi:hypothetical protein
MKCGTKKMASGGKVPAAVKTAIHKHEGKMHPGKPKTKLASGGMIARGGGAVTKKGALKFVQNG